MNTLSLIITIYACINCLIAGISFGKEIDFVYKGGETILLYASLIFDIAFAIPYYILRVVYVLLKETLLFINKYFSIEMYFIYGSKAITNMNYFRAVNKKAKAKRKVHSIKNYFWLIAYRRILATNHILFTTNNSNA